MRSSMIAFTFAVVATLGVPGANAARAADASAGVAALHGRIVGVDRAALFLRLRDGREVSVDISEARAKHRTGVLPIGGAVVVYGRRDSKGVFHATSIGHAGPNPGSWSADS